ncbi:MAG: ABC transporter permease, partial [Bacilli bacterium]|nr:ABC transporter permease [Bacilli bacterium]
MIKTYLKPLFKRFLGLFLSMAAVSMLAISLMICFLTGIGNLAIELTEYRDAYGDADGMIDTSLVERSKFAGLEDLPEIVDADSRLVSYGNLKREDGRVLTCRVLSHHSQDSIYQLYFDQQDLREGSPDVFLESVYAEHNGYQLGDVIQIGYYGFFLDCRVGAIVKTPESMYVRAEDYIWSDNYDFGYLYLEESLFSNLLLSLQSKIEDRIAENPEFEAYYEKAKESLGDSLPDLRAVTADTVASFGNQILLKAAPGVSQQAAVDAAVNYLKDQGVNVKSAKRGVETPSAMYMERAMKQLNVAAIFLPVFFFGVALVVTVLFINQIIKIMTPEIGTMVSIGISPKSITALFSVFILLMSLFSILLGVGIGWGLLSYVLTMFLKVYNLPAISFGLLWYVVLAASGLTILVGQGAVAVSSLLIYRITPKDAMLNNETKRKPLPKWIDRSLEKMPTITRL